MRKTRWVLAVLTALLAANERLRAQVLETFEGTQSGDISNTSIFNQTGTTASPSSTYTTITSPAIGAGAVTTTADETATYNQAFALPVGDQITVSAYVDQGNAPVASQVLIELGFGDQNTDVYHKINNNGFDIFSRLVSYNGNEQAFQPLTDNKASSGTAASEIDVLGGTPNNFSSAPAGSITLAGGNTPVWYLYSVTLQNLSTAGNFQEMVSLQKATVSGSTVTLGAVALSYSELYTNAGLESAATNAGLFTGFRSNAAAQSGENAIDNFAISAVSAVPEPASLGVSGIVGLLMLRRRHARGPSPRV